MKPPTKAISRSWYIVSEVQTDTRNAPLATYNCSEGQDTDASQTTGEENGEDGVENSSAADALDGLDPSHDVAIAIGEGSQEIAVDGENEGGAQEGE